MANQQEDLLARELGKLGSLEGKIGGGTAGALGGSLGTSLASRFVPTRQWQQQMSVSGDVAKILAQGSFFLRCPRPNCR